MGTETLEATARALVAPGKGILAADESTGTIEKRLKSIDVESTEDARRSYREMLFTTPGLGDHISGVILYDETIRQSTPDGVPFTKVSRGRGLDPGHQGRSRREAARGRRGRGRHRGPRRTPRPAGRVPGARGALHQVARGHRHRRRQDPERLLHARELPRARPLRRALAGSRARSHRGARGAHGRRAHARALLRGHRGDAPGRLQRALLPAHRLRGDAAEAEHGLVRKGLPAAGRPGGGRESDDPLLPERRPRRPCRESSSSPAARATRRLPPTSAP